jgi:rRNA maturation RNase YbeY
MRAIHERYTHKRGATDVLSFRYPRIATRGSHPAREQLKGEILLCTPLIRTRARKRNGSPSEEGLWLFIHGMLHLLGVHHSRRMGRIETDILNRMTTSLPRAHAAF